MPLIKIKCLEMARSLVTTAEVETYNNTGYILNMAKELYEWVTDKEEQPE